MSYVNSPNMGLPVPTVTNEPGPQYATDINQALAQIDSHNHSSGQGVPIGAQGINLTSDLAFNINNATSLRTARFVPTTATSGTDIGCLYVRSGDLFFNDISGNIVRITQNGGLSTTATFIGSISTTAIISAAGNTPATSGFIRMNNNTDFVSWRNAANNADDRIFFDSSDNLQVLGNVNGGVQTYGVRLLDQVGGKVVYVDAVAGSSAYTLTLPTRPSSTIQTVSIGPTGALITSRVAPTVQVFSSSGSGTYTTPAGVSFLKFKLVGGGGGGAGGGGAGANNGGPGAVTVFGASSAQGGIGGGANGGAPGAGGIAAVGADAYGYALTGSAGQMGSPFVSTLATLAGSGASSPFGGGGGGGAASNTGGNGAPGAGGGGGGGASGNNAGAGGGAGGYVEAYINQPSSTYSYIVGAPGAQGIPLGGNGLGGAGGTGFIFIEEYYS